MLKKNENNNLYHKKDSMVEYFSQSTHTQIPIL